LTGPMTDVSLQSCPKKKQKAIFDRAAKMTPIASRWQLLDGNERMAQKMALKRKKKLVGVDLLPITRNRENPENGEEIDQSRRFDALSSY